MNWRETLVHLAEKRSASAYVESVKALPPSLVGLNGYVGGISIWPVKSLGKLSVGYAFIGPDGLFTEDSDDSFADRSAMIVLRKPGKGHEYVRFSMREAPYLTLAEPHLWNGSLRYAVSGLPDLVLTSSMLGPRDGPPVTVRITQDELAYAALEHGPITEWIRQFVATRDSSIPCEKIEVLLPKLGIDRRVDELHSCGYLAWTRFTDGGQVTVLNSYTHRQLIQQRRAQNASCRQSPPEAFRMNITLMGLPPNTEDFIQEIAIRPNADSVRMLFGGMCIRCAVPCVDPDTGERPDTDLLTWLAKNRPPRPDKLNSVTFGINCMFLPGQAGRMVCSGDPFTVVAEK